MIGAGKHTECLCNLTNSEKGRALKSLTSMPHCGFSEYSAVLKATCCSPVLMLLQGENFLPLLCKLGFIAYPLRFTFIGTSIHDALKSCCFPLLYFCYVMGLIGALAIWKLMLPIFSLANIEAVLVTRLRWKRVLHKYICKIGNSLLGRW